MRLAPAGCAGSDRHCIGARRSLIPTSSPTTPSASAYTVQWTVGRTAFLCSCRSRFSRRCMCWWPAKAALGWVQNEQHQIQISMFHADRFGFEYKLRTSYDALGYCCEVFRCTSLLSNSLMLRFASLLHGGNRGSNPVGDANYFRQRGRIRNAVVCGCSFACPRRSVAQDSVDSWRQQRFESSRGRHLFQIVRSRC
jgi:hypothetical protein